MQSEQSQTGGNPVVEEGKEDKAALEPLIRRAMQGEREALASLCQAIAKGVLFRASYIMREQMDAEDAAQETLIRVCKNIHTLSDPKAFSAWLDRIIINETRRVAAKNSKHDSVLSLSEYLNALEEESEEDSVELLPLEFTVREDDRRVVKEIIDTLPNRQREAVLLHYFDGLNVTETAGAMEITKGKASYYLKLACEKVKDELSRRTGGQEAAAYGLGLLPIGPLLSQTLRLDEEGFSPANDAWVKQTLSKGAKATGGKASVAVGGGLASGWKIAGVFIALAAAVVVSFGAWINIIYADSKTQDTPVSVASEAQGQVALDGAGKGSFVNPSHAIAQAGTGENDMAALGWRITAVGSAAVLYSGDGGVVEDALSDLRAQGKDGEYLLSFHMVDAEGSTYTLSCNFLIRSE